MRIARAPKEAAEVAEERVRNVAAFPLAIPLMAGPGAITATVLLAGRAAGDPIRLGVLFGVIIAVCVACLATFLAANRIGRLLGITGNVVLTRLLGRRRAWLLLTQLMLLAATALLHSVTVLATRDERSGSRDENSTVSTRVFIGDNTVSRSK